MESIAPSTSNTIYENIVLSISILSRNIFGPNDTVTINFVSGSELGSTSSSNIILSSPLVSSYVTNVQGLNTIVFSSFIFYSTNYAPLDASITFNKIVQATSTKPRPNNTIELRRNGFLYNSDTFQYQVVEGVILNFTVTLDNNYANSNTSGVWDVTFSNEVRKLDKIYMNLPYAISVITCQPQCAGCSCSITMPTVNTPYTQLLINLDNLVDSLLT